MDDKRKRGMIIHFADGSKKLLEFPQQIADSDAAAAAKIKLSPQVIRGGERQGLAAGDGTGPMVRTFVVSTLLLASPSALAQEVAPRGGGNEYSLNLLLAGSKRYAFEGGASARIDGGAGIGASLVRNLNNYLAVGADVTFSEFDYRASVAPGAGNAGAGFDSDGSMETIALRLHATWYLLAGPVTPFFSAGVGANFLDPEFGSNPPANACWIYPWYGQVCGAGAPKTTLTRLGYSAGAGVRVDLPRDQGFIRVLVGGEWIDLPEALGTVGYVQLRADFGLRF